VNAKVMILMAQHSTTYHFENRYIFTAMNTAGTFHGGSPVSVSSGFRSGSEAGSVCHFAPINKKESFLTS